MDKKHLHIYYSGPRVASGSMSVRDLAPSISAFGNIFEGVNHIINEDNVLIEVNVKAFHSGSFGVAFEIITRENPQNSNSSNSAPKSDAGALIEVLLGSSAPIGLLELIRATKNRPYEISSCDDPRIVKLKIVESGDVVNVSKGAYSCYSDPNLRASILQFLRPLEIYGFEQIGALHGPNDYYVISSDDLPHFRL